MFSFRYRLIKQNSKRQPTRFCLFAFFLFFRKFARESRGRRSALLNNPSSATPIFVSRSSIRNMQGPRQNKAAPSGAPTPNFQRREPREFSRGSSFWQPFDAPGSAQQAPLNWRSHLNEDTLFEVARQMSPVQFAEFCRKNAIPPDVQEKMVRYIKNEILARKCRTLPPRPSEQHDPGSSPSLAFRWDRSMRCLWAFAPSLEAFQQNWGALRLSEICSGDNQRLSVELSTSDQTTSAGPIEFVEAAFPYMRAVRLGHEAFAELQRKAARNPQNAADELLRAKRRLVEAINPTVVEVHVVPVEGLPNEFDLSALLALAMPLASDEVSPQVHVFEVLVGTSVDEVVGNEPPPPDGTAPFLFASQELGLPTEFRGSYFSLRASTPYREQCGVALSQTVRLPNAEFVEFTGVEFDRLRTLSATLLSAWNSVKVLKLVHCAWGDIYSSEVERQGGLVRTLLALPKLECLDMSFRPSSDPVEADLAGLKTLVVALMLVGSLVDAAKSNLDTAPLPALEHVRVGMPWVQMHRSAPVPDIGRIVALVSNIHADVARLDSSGIASLGALKSITFAEYPGPAYSAGALDVAMRDLQRTLGRVGVTLRMECKFPELVGWVPLVQPEVGFAEDESVFEAQPVCGCIACRSQYHTSGNA